MSLNASFRERLVGAGKQNGRAPHYLVLGALFAWLVAWGGQHQPTWTSQPASRGDRQLRAEKFLVVDSAGKERAEFGVFADGGVGLVVRAKTGDAAAWVGVDEPGGPRLALAGRDGRFLAELGLLDQTTPVFILGDASGQRRIALYLEKDDGEARVDVFSKSGKSLCSFRVNADGVPRLLVRDEQGQGRIMLGVGPDGTCALDLCDRDRTRMTLSVMEDGTPGIVVLDSRGLPVWWHSKPAQ